MAPSRSRRAVLAASSALLIGSAGCLDDATRVPADSTPVTTTDPGHTDPDTTDSEPTATGPVAVENVRVQNHYVYLLASTHPRVARAAGHQYVIVAVSGGKTSSGDLEGLSLALDGERYPRSERSAYASGTYPVAAFAVPLDVSVDAGRIERGDRTLRTLDAAEIRRLNEPPVFEVSDVSAPGYLDGTDADVPLEISFTVENVGDGSGTFVADAGTSTLSGWRTVRVTVPPGESVTETTTVTIYGASTTEATAYLSWGSDEWSQAVTVDRPGTTTDASATPSAANE